MKEKLIYVAGHSGMVGSAVVRKLKDAGYNNLLAIPHSKLDLTDQFAVREFFKKNKPDIVIVAAARVGGILANNTYRSEFLYENLMIETNIINSAFRTKVEKLIFLGSSCIYPKLAAQPLKEEYLLSGYLEPTNEPYAIAKIAGIKYCEALYQQHKANFYSLMPTNLYGPNDNFNLDTSHVLPALIRKFHSAKIGEYSKVIVWGTGNPLREFLYVDDLAEAIVFCMENVNAEDIYSRNISHLNVGTGTDISIRELAYLVADVLDYKGHIEFDNTKPDGTPRKLLDVSRINKLGWKHKTDLRTGIEMTYNWFVENYNNLTKL
ncbi:MAG TPA: GDP-L-fucose synthase [Ignavibacteriales bacterium]|jgi:GDP-L-fucose synthase|nr:GDP-L-fucose synthase [Ignavibacteriales bacterium]